MNMKNPDIGPSLKERGLGARLCSW